MYAIHISYQKTAVTRKKSQADMLYRSIDFIHAFEHNMKLHSCPVTDHNCMIVFHTDDPDPIIASAAYHRSMPRPGSKE